MAASNREILAHGTSIVTRDRGWNMGEERCLCEISSDPLVSNDFAFLSTNLIGLVPMSVCGPPPPF